MRAYFCVVACVSLACGGVTTSPLFDAGGGADGGSIDAAVDAPGSGDSGPGAGCAKLLADLEAKRQAAVACCPVCNNLQCSRQIDGLCCPLTVTVGDSDTEKAYEAALDAVRAASCAVNCPELVCSSQPTGVCDPNDTCRQ